MTLSVCGRARTWELMKFLQHLNNNNNLNIKIRYKFGSAQKDFLDILFRVDDGGMCNLTFTARKLVNSLLHANSSHLQQIIKIISIGQFTGKGGYVQWIKTLKSRHEYLSPDSGRENTKRNG